MAGIKASAWCGSVSEGNKEKSKEKVHVAFLGWEVERITEPVLQENGDRLLLICLPRQEEGAWAYLERITEILEAKGVKVEVIQTSLYDINSLLSVLNKIFQLERARGNKVLINVSAGTKITASASTFASMYNEDVTAYYVHAENYYPREHFKAGETLSQGVKEIDIVPTCQVQVPGKKYIDTLVLVDDHATKDDRVYLKDMVDALTTSGVITVRENKDPRKYRSAQYMAALKLSKKLEKWGFIEISPHKRNKWVRLTSRGKSAIHMYRDYEIDPATVARDKRSVDSWILDLRKKDSGSIS